MMDDKYLAEIKAREQSATPGPWSVDTNEPFSRQINGVFADEQEKYVFYHDPDGEDTVSRKDADFIGHARTDIPALIAEVERLNGMVTRAQEGWYDADEQNATLKKALELAEDMLTKMTPYKSRGGWHDRLIHQAQQLTHETHGESEADHAE